MMLYVFIAGLIGLIALLLLGIVRRSFKILLFFSVAWIVSYFILIEMLKHYVQYD